ncbi:unnamed protein product [Rangifer tarandus platyrhynchus]|uniref:Uncharacterized protein n=1 Tax=Rangifer tarandus platyrhynchus TaxID=3082113 RepID=A0AC59ZU90_RANTA
MLAARGSAASFSATGLGSQRQLDLAAAGAWGFLGNEFLEPFPCSQTCLFLTRAVLVVGGPQFHRDGNEAGAQRDGEASEAAAAGAEGTAAGPSGKNREEKWMLQT